MATQLTGNLSNRIYEAGAAAAAITPAVGMLATVIMYSDRMPMKITEVATFKSGLRKGLASTITMECIDGAYKGVTREARQTAHGVWKCTGGETVRLGFAAGYYDEGF